MNTWFPLRPNPHPSILERIGVTPLPDFYKWARRCGYDVTDAEHLLKLAREWREENGPVGKLSPTHTI